MHASDLPEIVLFLDASRVGGIETHVIGLAGALTRAGAACEVALWRTPGPGALRSRLDAAGIRWSGLDGIGGLVERLRRRPMLLHTHGYKAGIVGRLAARIAGVPVVSSFHNGDLGEGRVRLYTALDRLTAGLAPSIAVASTIARRLPAPAAVVPNFIDVPPAPPPLSLEPRLVLFAGRMVADKGADLFCALAERRPKLRFVACGDGPDAPALMARHGARVSFLGHVADLKPFWRDTAVLVMPSRREGLPMVALEAMAHGVPVAAFAVGDLPEVVEHDSTGWLAEPGDMDALDAAIASAAGLSAARRASIVVAARSRVLRRFSTQAVLPQLLAVYRGALVPAAAEPALALP